jgi:hypothetical protein
LEESDAKPAETRPRLAGRYAIRRQLGRGMMGVVYEAQDSILGRTVAVKMIDLAFEVGPGAREDFERRFFDEARAAAKLSHPGIVVCHDVAKDLQSGQLFIVFEYLKGHTLAERVASGVAVPWRDAVPIVAKVARAIRHAHEHGVVHRDLKPANIMLLDSGVVKIMDFGVAKVESTRVKITATGQSFGSPLYMSPEQALGGASDSRSDIFSLGSVLSTLLLGRPCFDAPNIPRILGRVIREEPPPVSSIVLDVPPDLDRVISRALAKRGDDRYQSAEHMAEDLDDVLADREPRHLSGWIPPPAGTLPEIDHDALLAGLTPVPGTVGSPGGRTATVDILAALVGEPAAETAAPAPSAPSPSVAVETPGAGSAAPRRATSLRKRALAAVLVVVALLGGAYLILRGHSTPAPEALAALTPTAAPATAAPTAATEPPVPPTPKPTAVRTAVPATRAPTAATAVPEPTNAAVAARAAPPRSKSQLRLQIEHGLKDGSINVWLDGALVFDARLRAQIERKILAITVREGRIDKTLEVDPGRHEVRVEVGWDDNRRRKTAMLDVASDSAGVLEIRLSRGSLDLEWKPTDVQR